MYQGFYINLARNTKRREFLARHLEERGLTSRYQRFEAVDGRAVAADYRTALAPGALGCWLSHLGVLDANRGTGQHLHVIEDDAIFAVDAASRFGTVLRTADAQPGGWDLVFTDILLPLDVGLFQLLSEMANRHERAGGQSLADLAQVPFAACSSYFVNRQSVANVADQLQGGWQGEVPIDLYLRQLVSQGAVRAYVTVPFLTSVSPHSVASDIRGDLDRMHRVSEVYRRSFFLDADLRSLYAEIVELVRGTSVPPRAGVLLHALLFLLSDQFVLSSCGARQRRET